MYSEMFQRADTDIVFDASDDEKHIFAGYVKNIPYDDLYPEEA